MIAFNRRSGQGLHKKCKLILFQWSKVMINYILLYKIRRSIKKIIKEKIEDEEIATTKKSCIGCLADEISWEIYYLLKENKGEK